MRLLRFELSRKGTMGIPEKPVSHPAVRLAAASDVADMFTVRTSVRENHLTMEGLAERGVTPASVTAALSDDDWRTWVVEENGTICGFTMANSATGGVFALFVSPSIEGRGYGRALLAEAERWLFARGHEVIWLETDRDPSTRAHRLYQSAGWVPVGPAEHGDVRYEKRRASLSTEFAELRGTAITESTDVAQKSQKP